jgi:hypothetical protein
VGALCIEEDLIREAVQVGDESAAAAIDAVLAGASHTSPPSGVPDPSERRDRDPA